MTIDAPIATRHDYDGNDIATSFPYSVKIDDKTFIKVLHINSSGVENEFGDLVVDIDYTVTNVGNENGGAVLFPKVGSLYSTLATGVPNEKLALIYDAPIEQTLDIPNRGRVFNSAVENKLDYIVKLQNQTQEQHDRSLKVPENSTLTNLVIPVGANKLLKWNPTANNFDLVSVGSVANVDPIAVKGDIVQGDSAGDAAKLAIGVNGKGLSVVSGLLAYDWFRNLTSTKGTDIASATALVIPDSKDNYWDITGTNAITSISATNLPVGAIIRLHFDGALTLTHHATNLVLPNAANITTIAGDEAVLLQYDTDKYRLIGWAGHVLAHTHADAANGGNILTAPAIADFVNATHNHLTSAEGGVAGEYIRLHDSKATTVSGGTFTLGAWRKRDITEDQDTGSNVSVASSVITLEAGTYDCHISCPAYEVNSHQARLRNTTDNVTVLLGNSARSGSSANGETIPSVIRGRFTIAAQKTFEIQHRCETTITTVGFGRSNSFGENEIYTVAEFWKVGQ